MLIKEIMDVNFEIIAPDDPISLLADRMLKRHCSCIIVVKDDRLVGVITDRDIALHCIGSGYGFTDVRAEAVMSAEILCCDEMDNIGDVARNMTLNKLRLLAVLDAKKKLVGTVSLGELAVSDNWSIREQPTDKAHRLV